MRSRYRKVDFDISHPKRQKNVIEEVNSQLPNADIINQHDIQCIKGFTTSNQTRLFCKSSKFVGFPQYTDAFIGWLISEYRKNKKFFHDCREKALQMKK